MIWLLYTHVFQNIIQHGVGCAELPVRSVSAVANEDGGDRVADRVYLLPTPSHVHNLDTLCYPPLVPDLFH